MSIYMKVPGADGSVTATGYEKWIELDSMQFGVGRHVGMDVGNMANRAAGLPNFSEVSVSKQMEESSHALLNDAVLGKSGKKIEIAVVEVGDTAEEMVKYDLEDSIFSSFSMSAGGGGRPQESLSISYSKLTVSFAASGKDHKAGATPRVIYDLTLAKKG
jgi:type VI secretion system secreted protein Hcp